MKFHLNYIRVYKNGLFRDDGSTVGLWGETFEVEIEYEAEDLTRKFELYETTFIIKYDMNNDIFCGEGKHRWNSQADFSWCVVE